MHHIKIYILTLICSFVLFGTDAQVCENLYLQSMYEKLPSAIKAKSRGKIKGFDVEMIYNADSVISSLGVKLPIFEGDTTLIGSFVERYTLDLLLAERDIDIKNVLDRNKSKLYLDGSEYQKLPYWDLLSGLEILNRSVSLDIRRDSLDYSMVWRDSNGASLGLKFPANVQIITGKDKIELESGIEDQIVACANVREVGSSSLGKEPDFSSIDSDLYIYRGATFLLDSVSNTTYYSRKRANKYAITYSPDMIAPTLSNLILLRSKYGDQTTIRIEQKMYGNQTKRFEITTNTLRSFCEAHGLDTYVGIENVTDNRVEATVLLHNVELNYVHMLYIITDIESLFGSKQKFMSAQLFSYIPFDNVADVFEKYK